MKAKFFFLGLCALALAACSIDEVSQVNDTNAISFKATATRATAATTNTIDAFTVWAWEKVDGTPEFMNGVQAVRASEGSSTYTTTRTYYWPGAALDFYAFIPAATVETDSSADYNAYFGEYVDLSSDVIEGSTDSYSYEGYVANATITSPDAITFDVHVPADATKEIDLGYAATLGQSAGTVGLNFRHALSQVAFKAQNGNPNWTVDIKGVTLCGIFKEGTYTLPTFGENENGTTTHNATDATKGTWTIAEGAVQGRFDAGIAETKLDGTSSASQSITATDGALMLIPQTVAAWEPLTDPTNTEVGAYIRINCQVIENDTGDQIWPNYHELDDESARLDYAEITVPFDVDWEEGSLYTYTIVFGEGLGYYAPDDPDTDLDGKPVLIPIRFTVDIDDFGNTDEVDEDTDTSSITVHSATELQAAVAAGHYTDITVAYDTDSEGKIELDSYLEFNSDCTLTIEEGVTVTCPNATEDVYIDHSGTTGTYTAAIYVNGCNVTIEGSGTVETDGTTDAFFTNAIWVVDGSVTVKGGTYLGGSWNAETTTENATTTKHAVYCGDNGYAYIYDGTFSAGISNHSGGGTEHRWVLNLHDASYKEGKAMIWCYGGKYYGFDPSNPKTDDAESYVAEGYTVTYDETTDYYTVVEEK